MADCVYIPIMIFQRISLEGDILPSRPLTRAWDNKGALFTGGITVAATLSEPLLALPATGFFIGSRLQTRWAERRLRQHLHDAFGSEYKELAINKRPKQGEITAPNHRLSAQLVSNAILNDMVKQSLLYAGMAMAGGASLYLTGVERLNEQVLNTVQVMANIDSSGMLASGVVGGITAINGALMSNFYNIKRAKMPFDLVSAGIWTIESQPPPLRSTAKEKLQRVFGIFSPGEQPAYAHARQQFNPVQKACALNYTPA
jgi:hypothetical protein